MAYHWATWLAPVLNAAGLKVVEKAGWTTRGLAGGVFQPRAVVWHHDASPPGDSPGVPDYLVRNFQTASAQCWVDRYGVWYLIGAGRAPHAGPALPGKPGNADSIGIETDHTTNEPWPAVQLDSLRRGTAAILTHLKVAPDPGLEFHKTICSPPGRKVDPAGLDLPTERAAVAAISQPPEDDDMPAPILIVRDTTTGAQWVGDFITRRHIASPGEREAVNLYAKNAGLRIVDADYGADPAFLGAARTDETRPDGTRGA